MMKPRRMFAQMRCSVAKIRFLDKYHIAVWYGKPSGAECYLGESAQVPKLGPWRPETHQSVAT